MLIEKTMGYLLPSACVLCHGRAHAGNGLCFACEASLPMTENTCLTCGFGLISDDGSAQLCGHCQQHPPYVDGTLALCRYQTPINHFITQLKFQHQLIYARLFSNLFVQALKERWKDQAELPDIIIPVPLHSKRLKERGFNQAMELAKPIAKHYSLPKPDIHLCTRIRNTTPQSDLPAKKRRKNVKNAFVLTGTLHEKHVAIMDDVVTTSSTVNEIARLCKQAGARKVMVWCCARSNRQK